MPNDINASEPISAIHARETRTGSWSGSGIMLGTGGLGLGIGAGSVDTQTVRARAFSPPSASYLAALLPGIVMIVVSVLIGWMPTMVSVSMFSFPAEGGGVDPAIIEKVSSIAQTMGFALSFIVLCLGLIKLIGPFGRQAMAATSELDQKQMTIYNRLRLDEKTNTVFDPDTGLSSDADRESILGLISSILNRETKT